MALPESLQNLAPKISGCNALKLRGVGPSLRFIATVRGRVDLRCITAYRQLKSSNRIRQEQITDAALQVSASDVDRNPAPAVCTCAGCALYERGAHSTSKIRN